VESTASKYQNNRRLKKTAQGVTVRVVFGLDLVSNLGRHTGYAYGGFSWYSYIPLGKSIAITQLVISSFLPNPFRLTIQLLCALQIKPEINKRESVSYERNNIVFCFII
jgi:hypothetical protein